MSNPTICIGAAFTQEFPIQSGLLSNIARQLAMLGVPVQLIRILMRAR